MPKIMSDETSRDGVDLVSFSFKLESSAESFWGFLNKSKDFNVQLSSIQVMCNITKFILENDDLCRACVTKYKIYSKVFRVSKKAFRSQRHGKKGHTRSGSIQELSNFHTNSVFSVKVEDADVESFTSVVKLDSNSSEDELNLKDKPIGTSELVREALLQASDIQDFTYFDTGTNGSEKVCKKSTNREKRYACSICRKNFLRPYLVKKHLKTVHNKKEMLQNGEQFIIVKGNSLKELLPHVCPLCGKKFKEKRYLNNHYKFHTGQKRFACKICNRGFLWLCHTKKHIKDVHNKDETLANVDQYVKRLTLLDSRSCDISADLNVDLEGKEQTSFSCNQCEKKFSQKQILNIHLQQKHYLGSDISSLQNSQIHFSEGHSSKNKLSSKIKTLHKKSNMSFTATKLDSEAFSHTDSKSLLTSQDMFEDVFKDSSLEEQAKDLEKTFSCSYCEKCFTGKILVELHIFLTHEQDRLDTLTDENGQYICPICEKRIGAKRNFKAHLHIHVKERYFICTVCNKSFLWHSCATRHVKTHGVLDVNHYMKMVTSENMTTDKDISQRLVSDPEVNEKIDYSGETFSNGLNFQQDMSGCGGNANVSEEETEETGDVGDGHEKTGCTVCSRCCRGFMTHGAWKEHMKTCSVQTQYKCFLCSMPFPTKCSAHRHLRRVHNKESDEIDQLVGEETLLNCTAVPVNDPENVTYSESHFMCSVCKKFFRERRYLRQHMWTHRRQWMHRCKHCARYFTKKQFLQEHIVNRHSLGGIKTAKVSVKSEHLAASLLEMSDSHLCAVCGDPNADITPDGNMCLSCKDNGAGGGGILTCGVCGIKMKNRHDLVVHSRTHEIREHKCEVCGKIYKQKKLLDVHKKEHSGEKPFCCEACGLRFASSERLRFHNYNVHSERLRRNAIKFYASSLCPICDIRVRIKDQMWNHLLIHSGNFELNCNYCDRFFTYTEELSAHGHSVHTNTEMPFTCYLCETRFSEKAKLLEHFRLHPEKEVHLCTHCSSTFYLKADLREHVKSKHERKKRNTVQEQALAGMYRGPFPCKMCGRVYQKKASLDIHMKIHYGIFDFPCDFCEKKFKSAAECRIHRRQHTKEKPYQCPFCGEKFNRHSTLTQHKRRHTDERPYLCDDCGMAFRTRKTLQNHKLTHTKNTGMPQKTVSKAPHKPLPSMTDISIQLPQHMDMSQQVPMMHRPDVSHYFPYWEMPRT